MTYRALFVADVHAGNSLPWAVKDPETLITDRLHDIIDVLTQMTDYANERMIIDIWVLGDLIDKRLVDAVTLKLVTAKLMEMKAQGLVVRLIPGNHEAGDAAGKHFTLDAFSDMGFWVAGINDASDQISVIHPVPGFEVVAMPYLPISRAVQIAESGKDFHLMLLHQTIKGGMVGGWESPDGLDPEMLESVATHVFSGHFHTPQTIGKHVHYLGAPVQGTFGDAGEERGFWDVSWTGKFCKRVKVPIVGAPRFHELIWKVGDDPPRASEINPKDYVTVKVSGLSTEVNKLWITAEEWCAGVKAEGARLCRPVPLITKEPTKARISLGADGDRPTWDTVLSRYLDAADCSGLNRQRLEQLGKELMADADK